MKLQEQLRKRIEGEQRGKVYLLSPRHAYLSSLLVPFISLPDLLLLLEMFSYKVATGNLVIQRAVALNRIVDNSLFFLIFFPNL